MRSWYLSRIALERRFEPHPGHEDGVYDRRPTTPMFIARVVSGCLAFSAFIYGLSLTNIRRSKFPKAIPTSAPSNATVALSQGSLYYTSSPNRIFNANPVFNGTWISASDGTEFVFQKPEGYLMGTVLMLHGCSHAATDFFPRGTHCKSCIGLPEELRLTRAALARGYSVIAVSSTNRVRKCWSTHPKDLDGPDYDRVSTALREAQARSAYSPLVPLFAIGVSSGGLFATSLPFRFRVSGVNSIVSSSVCLLRGDGRGDSSTLYPAHVFTHMGARDKGTAQRVQQAMKLLTALGTPSVEFNISPKRVTEDYLRDSLPKLNDTLIQDIVSSLQRAGHLNREHELQSDPRQSSWRASIQHLRDKLGDTLRADESALSEELNRAWGGHEITSEHFENTLDFLEGRLTRQLPE